MKVIVFDLDGTLLDTKNEIIGGEKTLSLLNDYQESGYRLAICTGRLDHDIVAINRKYHLGITERISQNGAVIYQGNQLNAVLLDKQAAVKIYDLLTEYDVRVEMNTVSNRYWMSPRDPDFPKEFYDSSIIKEDFKAIIPYQPVVLYLVVGEEECLKEIQTVIKKKFTQVDAILTSKTSLEIVPLHISKGEAIRVMYPEDEVYAIGDSESDLAMLEYAHRFYYVKEEVEGAICVESILEALEKIKEG